MVIAALLSRAGGPGQYRLVTNRTYTLTGVTSKAVMKRTNG
jgi:hypothetical protein